MPESRRPRTPRSLLVPVVAVLVASQLAWPALARAEEGSPAGSTEAGAEVGSGDTVVGELVQAWPEHVEPALAAEHGDEGPLTWVEPPVGEAVRIPTESIEDVPRAEAGATVSVTVGDEVVDEAAAEEGVEPAREVLDAAVVEAAPADAAPPTAAAGTVTNAVTLVMVVPNGGQPDGRSMQDVANAVNGTVSSFWAGQSDSAVRIGVTASIDRRGQALAAPCNQPFAMWDEVATAIGWAQAPGRHLLLHVPAGTPGCAADGLAVIGSALNGGGRLYVRDIGNVAVMANVVAHELGHNFGLGHASEQQCDRALETGTCQVNAYNDWYDVMGLSWNELGSLNAPHAARLGLLPGAEKVSLTPSSASARYTLAPMAAPSGTRALQLTAASGTVYWLEYRQGSGQDGWLGTWRNGRSLDQGVTLRRDSSGSHTSLLLDGTPSAPSGWSSDLQVALPLNTPVKVAGGAFTLTVTGTSAGGATVDVSTGTTAVREMTLYHQSTGGAGGPLGTQVDEPRCGLAGGGCRWAHQGGTIFWSAATGPHMVRGALLEKYEAAGGPNALGYPLADDGGTADRTGALVRLQGGDVYWSPATGAHVVRGGILAKWRELNGHAGPLGYPTGDDAAVGDGRGYLTTFAGGTIYWSAATGAQMVRGALLQKYVELGGPAALGYPVADDGGAAGGGGALVRLQGGDVYWSPSTGAHVVRGAILARWRELGGQLGGLGYPTGDDAPAGHGGYQTAFAGGTLYWSPWTGVTMVRGAILAHYVALGGPAALGYPIADDGAAAGGGGALVRLQGGDIYWSPSTGAHVVRGAILAKWRELGGQLGPLGYPTGDDAAVGDGVGYLTTFAGGNLYWSAATGTHMVRGALLQQYVALGGPPALGYPTTDDDATPTRDGAFVRLQRGDLYWSPATGAHHVRGATAAAWRLRAAQAGPLGYPTVDSTPRGDGTGWDTVFQRGTLFEALDGQVSQTG